MKANKSNKIPSIDKKDYVATDLTYLDKAALLDEMKEFKLMTYEKMKILEGQKILDVGCGTGNVALELSKLVGPTGEVSGIDANGEGIEKAKSKLNSNYSNINFSTQNAENLSFSDNYFDSSRSERVFQHLLNPDKVLQEMVRVTRPNGNIVVADPDWATLIINSDYKKATKLILEEYGKTMLNTWMGRKLSSLFVKANLKNINISGFVFISTDMKESFQLFPLNVIADRLKSSKNLSENETNEWLEDLKEKDKNGTFFCSGVGFVVSGTK